MTLKAMEELLVQFRGQGATDKTTFWVSHSAQWSQMGRVEYKPKEDIIVIYQTGVLRRFATK